MALRIPGKGNFKPVKPLKPTVRRPPIAPSTSSSQPTPSKAVRPTIVTAAATQPVPPVAAASPSTTTEALSPVPQVVATPTPAPAPAAQEAKQPKASAPTPAVASEPSLPPPLLPSALSPTETDKRQARDSSVASEIAPPTPSAGPASPATPATPATPRGARKGKTNPLLAAAAASKTPSQKPGTLREREKQKRKERAEKLAEIQTTCRFTPTASPAPSTPVDSTGVPSTLAAHESKVARSPTQSVKDSGGIPPTVAASVSDLPPMVASATGVKDSPSGTPDPDVLAAAIFGINSGDAAVARKRTGRGAATPDTDGTPATSPKRRRTVRQGTVDTDAGSVASGDNSDGGKPKRTLRGAYGSRGRAGTANDRRTAPFRRQSAIPQLQLDGVEANDMVGEEVDASVVRMGDLATLFAGNGRVSARTIKLANFQRTEDERKLRERAERTERNWRRRQIVRRKARELRNNQRANRREAACARGDDPDGISADEVDSDEDFEVEPDRLTPPGSPQQAERIAPVRFEPKEADETEGAEPSGTAQNPAEVEDIEGLGLHNPSEAPDEEIGETMEDFQLPVEDDGPADGTQDFSGLEYQDYTGGYLDDEGNWVEGGNSQAALLQQRNEERRRRIMDGDHGQQVELIDNDTQFVNSATWGKKVNNDRWTAEETELFFAVLRETGENYTLMKAYFPGRTVRQLKNKGSRENRVHQQRMTDAIMNRRPMDKQYLAKSAGFNIDRPYDRENAFFAEVAAEKDRVVAGLLPIGQEMDMDAQLEVQTAWDGLDNLEFGVPA